MAGFTFSDLDLEALEDARDEIGKTRRMLGKITVRDMMEAVYGTAYTIQVLGENGGEDVLMEDLRANDDVRSMAGNRRLDEGNNHGIGRNVGSLTAEEREAARRALIDQEQEVEQEIDRIHEGGPFSRVAKDGDKLLDDFNKLSVDQQKALLRKLAASR